MDDEAHTTPEAAARQFERSLTLTGCVVFALAALSGGMTTTPLIILGSLALASAAVLSIRPHKAQEAWETPLAEENRPAPPPATTIDLPEPIRAHWVDSVSVAPCRDRTR